MNWRYRFTFFIILILLGLVSFRLYYWQIVKADELSQLAKSQYSNQIELLPIRGEIRSSDSFPLVTNKISYLVFANPKEVGNKNKLTDILYPILSVDKASISAQLSRNLYWVPLKNNVESTVKDQIENLHLPGVGFEQQYSRFYPEASLAAQLLGFVGKDEYGNDKGYFGIEGYYDRLLAGKPGIGDQVTDAMGRPILSEIEGNLVKIDGSNLNLSIDRTVQYLIERKLKEGVETYGAESGMIGVMDPSTGNIIAMAAYPSFSPIDYWDYTDSLYMNPFISDTYEPGSTFKPLVMSSAMDANLVTPDTKCPICSKPVSVGGYELHTWDDKYFPNTSMTDVIIHSDNTGMVFVAQKLGVDRMISYLTKFGIGKTTGIDLQGEVAPVMQDKQYWYPVDLATAGFGQGISVTPIELLDAFSAIANKGNRMEPHIVSSIETPEGQVIPIPPKVLDTPISEKTAKIMTEMLVDAVDKGEASFARLHGYRIAGKTGTASIPVSGHYDPSQTIASFIGFAPADNPKFVMLVIMNRPTASIYGSETAAPVFFDIAKSLLMYYGIAPTENQ